MCGLCISAFRPVLALSESSPDLQRSERLDIRGRRTLNLEPRHIDYLKAVYIRCTRCDVLWSLTQKSELMAKKKTRHFLFYGSTYMMVAHQFHHYINGRILPPSTMSIPFALGIPTPENRNCSLLIAPEISPVHPYASEVFSPIRQLTDLRLRSRTYWRHRRAFQPPD